MEAVTQRVLEVLSVRFETQIPLIVIEVTSCSQQSRRPISLPAAGTIIEDIGQQQQQQLLCCVYSVATKSRGADSAGQPGVACDVAMSVNFSTRRMRQQESLNFFFNLMKIYGYSLHLT
ncbi:hypothetical protein RRG08_027715 [Elysia crispata]|uniref:Uncharacterized protein n=1 Tax=Elysia crispata TaxID=231223 RepID=A0AAE0XM98_9GAST|nr:hypothetical protein RRG08_027715 [Elysia crispata]